MTTSATQTTAAPVSSFASRYAAYSPAKEKQSKPFNKTFTFFFSEPKAGKTNFIESNPTGLRIDFDRAGNSNPQPLCITVPALTDGTGRPIMLTKSWFDGLVAQLVKDAKDNAPRPETIYIDTVDALKNMLCEQIAADNNVKNFYDLPAKTWGLVYALIRDYCNKLVQAGYGVWLTSHMVNKKIEIGDQAQMQLDLSVPDTLYTSLTGGLDLILGIDKGQEVQKIPVYALHPITKEIIMVNGSKKIDRYNDERTNFVDLVFNQTKPSDPFAPNFSRLVRQRINGLPDRIRLPRVGAWELVRDTYDKAAVTDGAALVST